MWEVRGLDRNKSRAGYWKWLVGGGGWTSSGVDSCERGKARGNRVNINSDECTYEPYSTPGCVWEESARVRVSERQICPYKTTGGRAVRLFGRSPSSAAVAAPRRLSGLKVGRRPLLSLSIHSPFVRQLVTAGWPSSRFCVCSISHCSCGGPCSRTSERNPPCHYILF